MGANSRRADRFIRQLAASMDQQVALGTTPQLPWSTIVDGALTIASSSADGSTLSLASIGVQPDGSVGMQVIAGPPPPTPTDPGVIASVDSAVVAWNGFFAGGAATPFDLLGIEVHIGDPALTIMPSPATLKGTITSADGGGSITVGGLTGTGLQACLLARSTSLAASPPSNLVSVVLTAATVAAGSSFQQVIGDGVGSQFTLVHNLGTTAVQARVARVSDGVVVWPGVSFPDINTARIDFEPTVPEPGQYVVTVWRVG